MTPNPTQRRTYSKTFITSVFSVVLSGAQTPSTEYKSEYEYEKSFITLAPELGREHALMNFLTSVETALNLMYLKNMLGI